MSTQEAKVAGTQSRGKVLRCLAIAGSDSGGGAGIQADLKTFAARGVFGMSAITAVTAQNTTGITSVFPVPPDQVKAQIDAVLTDLGADAIKVGMLVSKDVTAAVADALKRHFGSSPASGTAVAEPRRLPPIVLDSVMVAKGGHPLLEAAAIAELPLILGYACLVTPNIPEALLLVEHLGGCHTRADGRVVKTVQHVRELALQLAEILRTKHGYTGSVLVKGGHLEGERPRRDGGITVGQPDMEEPEEANCVVDVLCDSHGRLEEFVSPRLLTRSTHGTGCTLSSAIAAELARGRDLRAAVEKAVRYVHGAIMHAPPPDDATPAMAVADAPSPYALGSGHGPLDHMWKLKPLLPGIERTWKEHGFVGEMWRSVEGIFKKILSHPFIEGLTSGDLPQDVFQFYIVQDMHYLRDYSRCLALLAAKADASPSMLLFLESAKTIVGGECAMHLEFCQEWGMTKEESTQAVLEAHPASPTNTLYTSYLLRIAYDRPYYEGVAAVLPCAWIYNEVGNYLKSRGSPNPQYARWIATYGGEEFNATTNELIKLTNKVAAALGAQQKERMRDCFVQASRLEYMFWDMSYAKQAYPL